MQKSNIFKIFKLVSNAGSYMSRNGVKGPARSFIDSHGDLHKINGFGNEKVFSFKQLNAYAKTDDGKFYQSDIYRNLRHVFPEIKNPKKLNDLASQAIQGIEMCDGEVEGSHYPNSKFFWITNILELLEIGRISRQFEKFENNNEVGPQDLDSTNVMGDKYVDFK